MGTSDKRPVIADLCLPRDSGVGRRQVAGAGRWGTAGAGTREGRRLHVSGGAQWNQSRAAGAEEKAGGMGGERGRGVEGRARGDGADSDAGVVQGPGAFGRRQRWMLAALWLGWEAGETSKTWGWGQPD